MGKDARVREPLVVHYLADNEQETLCGSLIANTEKKIWWVRKRSVGLKREVNCPTCLQAKAVS